jgi:tetratricopeptide (TPR) repeat protein
MKTYAPGTRIGQYEVAGRPLIGGMSIVYVCIDHRTDWPVILKTFQPHLLPDRAARDRFLREGTAWVDLGAHPHIVRCYRVIRPEDSLEVYLVLELVVKEQERRDATLRAWLMPGQPLPVLQALLFALQIARGMRYATEKIPGFVHRDLKPENVLVGADRLSKADVNRLRVTDFGLAAVLQGVVNQTSKGFPTLEVPMERTQLTRGIVGTPLYMAPEQWQGESLCTATDIYGWGCILYEMLVGRHAVAGRTVEALQRAHCTGNVRPLPNRLPAGVRALVTRCLMLKPGERYESWEAVEAALAAAYKEIVGSPVPAAEPVDALGQMDRVAAGGSYIGLGTSYVEIGKAEVAARYFERALEVGRTEGERTLEGAALNCLGSAHLLLGDAQRATEYCEQALAIAREIGDRHGEGNALGNLGSAYIALGDAQRAIEYCQQALAIARQTGSRHGESTILSSLGLAYATLGNARRAIKYYEQHLENACEIGDRCEEGRALGNLGTAYAALGDTRRALGYFEQHLEIAREIGDRRGEGTALGNVGEAYRTLGAMRRAIVYYERSLEIACEIGDREGEGTAYGNLAIAYESLGDVRRVMAYYGQALAIHREIGNAMGVATNSFNMALLYARQGEMGRALPLAQEAARIWAQIGHAQYTQRAQQVVAQIKAGQ